MKEIYILAGQSNMSGRGALSQVPVFTNASRISIWTGAGWVQGCEPVDSDCNNIDGISCDSDAAAGPGMAFADRLATLRPSVEIGLIPCAKGGSWMRDWRRDWRRSALYGSMIAKAISAQSYGELKGLLWYQGESDTADLQSVMDWPARFSEMVFAIRSDLDIPNLPVVFAQLAAEPNIYPWVNWGRMQLYQSQISAPGVAMITTSDLPVQDDKMHLTTAGCIEAGRRFAERMNELLLI